MAVPATSVSLLKVLGEDPQSPRWTEFFTKYESTIRGYLIKYFPTVDADEVINDTLLALVKELPVYTYDPDVKGHFRNYLIGIVRFKAIAKLKKFSREAKLKEELEAKALLDWEYEKQAYSVDLRNWRHEAYEAALAQFMADPNLSPRDKEIFKRVTLKEESPDAVAKDLGIKRNNVDQIKARMLTRLKELALRYAAVCEEKDEVASTAIPRT